MTRTAATALLLASILAATAPLVATAGSADNDAGTGTDAGDTRALATPLAYGRYEGNLTPHDADWYAVSAPAATPRCVVATATAENNLTLQLSLERAGGSRTATVVVPNGTTQRLAIAVPTLDRALANLTASANDPNKGDPARPGWYRVGLAEQRIAAGTADAGTGVDASGALAQATPIAPGCSSGRLGLSVDLFDDRDAYAFAARAGERVHYSVAHGLDPAVLTLRVLNATGADVGPSLRSGDLGSFVVPQTGTFYLATSTTSMTESIDYVVGLAVGPDPPGSTCRPHCRVLE